MLKKCIFDSQIIGGKNCDREHFCEGCPTKESLKTILSTWKIAEVDFMRSINEAAA